MKEKSGAGAWYDMIGAFAALWRWEDTTILKMPVRRRKKMITVLKEHLKSRSGKK